MVREVLNIVLKGDGFSNKLSGQRYRNDLEYSIMRATKERVFFIAKGLCARFQCVAA